MQKDGAQQEVGVQQEGWGAAKELGSPSPQPWVLQAEPPGAGALASHMRWIIWIMASVGTVYVFFFHERSVPSPSPALPFLP